MKVRFPSLLHRRLVVGWLVVLVAPHSPTSCGLVYSPPSFEYVYYVIAIYVLRFVGPGVRWGAIHYNQQYKSLQY